VVGFFALLKILCDKDFCARVFADIIFSADLIVFLQNGRKYSACSIFLKEEITDVAYSNQDISCRIFSG
jgi:hypothetical protein